MSHPTTTTTIPPAGPIDILTTLIIALLAPMFLTATGGDLAAARAAAADSIEAYRARTHADLLAVAQIVAFSLSALGSLSLAMAPEIPIPLTLRLRGNANACNRSVEQNRRALLHPNRTDTAAPTDPPPFVPEPDQDAYEAQVIANVAATQQRIAETHPGAATLPRPHPGQTASVARLSRSRHHRSAVARPLGVRRGPGRGRIHRRHPQPPAAGTSRRLDPRRRPEQLCQ
jgi:hypothetical protein